MGSPWLAIRCFFAILFQNRLPEEAIALLPKKAAPKAAPAAEKPATPPVRASDGALQILSILQRDSRLVDFLMEDISGYSDDQVGAAVRSMQEHCRESLSRHLKLAPVIDGVEGTSARVDSAGPLAKDASAVKFLGNVPASGRAPGGTLRHRGWRADKIDLPVPPSGQNLSIIAPAEIEVE